jgi:hypothetical protein
MDYTTAELRDGLYVLCWEEPESGAKVTHIGVAEQPRLRQQLPTGQVHADQRHLDRFSAVLAESSQSG